MNLIERMAAAALLLIILPACSRGQVSGEAAVAAPVAPVTSVVMTLPEEADVVALVGSAVLDFPGDPAEEPVPIADRILDGFQAGPSQLRLDDGSVIHWGFKHEEANFQSVAINDAQGHLRLLGAVNNIGRLTSSYAAPIETIEAYQKRRRAAMLDDASVTLFVGEPTDLDRYLPVVKRWLQADLLGFNADCGAPALKSACELATQINLPVAAYAVAPQTQTLSPVHVPDAEAAPIPIGHFIQ